MRLLVVWLWLLTISSVSSTIFMFLVNRHFEITDEQVKILWHKSCAVEKSQPDASQKQNEAKP